MRTYITSMEKTMQPTDETEKMLSALSEIDRDRALRVMSMPHDRNWNNGAAICTQVRRPARSKANVLRVDRAGRTFHVYLTHRGTCTIQRHGQGR